jgi:predicted nuclease of predicted toxin-antitoxin system
MGSSDDSIIWQYAKENGFTIISKDSDFQDRSILHGHPPKFIWLRAENCTMKDIENLIRSAASTIRQFLDQEQDSYLVLWSRRKPQSSKKQ